MPVDDANVVCTVGLENDGHIDLSEAEARDLAKLITMPGWKVLRQILNAMQDGCTVALRDRTKGLEDLRYAQGQSACAGRIADIVEKDIPEWYTERAAEGSSETHEPS